MKRNIYFKLFITILAVVIFIITVVGQNTGSQQKKSTTNNSTNSVHKVKPKVPTNTIKKQDTIQLASIIIADAMRTMLQRYMSKNFFKVELNITPKYPIEIMLTHSNNGQTRIEGSKDSITINGNILMKTIGSTMVISFPKKVDKGNSLKVDETGDESSMPILMADNPITIKENQERSSAQNDNVFIFSSSGSSINNSSSVQSIKPGKIECSGHYLLNASKPLYFERGTIHFDDNTKPCVFSEGTIFYYNGVGYKNTNSKWIKLN